MYSVYQKQFTVINNNYMYIIILNGQSCIYQILKVPDSLQISDMKECHYIYRCSNILLNFQKILYFLQVLECNCCLYPRVITLVPQRRQNRNGSLS